jgi:hypothetical protein
VSTSPFDKKKKTYGGEEEDGGCEVDGEDIGLLWVAVVVVFIAGQGRRLRRER